ncbi:MAG: NERD domain-containing protein [Chloroflexota bacterium]
MPPYMYPESLEGADVRSQAEIRLFDEFQKQLTNDFHVIHSVAWIGIRRNYDRPSDGETDFIVIHPRMGVLLIEVKGGIIGYDEQEGWYSVRKDRTRVLIKNPFLQVKDNKYALIRKIESLPNWQGAIPTIGHAVAFPDGTLDLPNMGPEAPREIILLHNDMGDLETWIRKSMKFWAGGRFCPPGDQGVTALRDLLRKSWLMKEPRLGEEIDLESTAIRRYTEEQFMVLELLAGRRRAAIRGCAGSGKTMLAIEKARRLAAEGFRTLFTCYNRNLAASLKQIIGKSPRLKIQGFHALCQEFAIKTGRNKRADWNDQRPGFFDRIMPEVLADAAESGDESFNFDAIVVDEGQDFADTWWTALEMLLADPGSGVFYVFYDDNQLIYPRRINLPVGELPFALTTNCRNTRKIHQAVIRFYRSDLKIKSRGPEGREIGLDSYGPPPLDLQAKLTEVLARLIFAEKVPVENIVILSPGGLDRPPLSKVTHSGVFRLVADLPQGTNEIQCTTIRLFKGLESPVIILVCPAASDEMFDELMYVGISRAQSHLEILTEDGLNQSVLDRFRDINPGNI